MIFFKHVCYVCAHYYMHIHFLVCVCVYSAHVHVCSSSSPRELALLQALFSRANSHFYRPTNRFQTTNCFQKSTVFKNPTVFKRRSRTHEFKTRTPVQNHKRFFQIFFLKKTWQEGCGGDGGVQVRGRPRTACA